MHIGINPAISDGGYLVDEKRKIVINTRDLTNFQFNLYMRGMYKRLRPDLTDYDFMIWKSKYLMGEHYLNQMRSKLNQETQRSALQGHMARSKTNMKYFNKQLIDLSQPFVRGPRYHVERTWEEASKIAQYVDKITDRISKYYLQYPVVQLPYDKCQELEDELTERLVREMRKPPHKKEEASEE